MEEKKMGKFLVKNKEFDIFLKNQVNSNDKINYVAGKVKLKKKTLGVLFSSKKTLQIEGSPVTRKGLRKLNIPKGDKVINSKKNIIKPPALGSVLVLLSEKYQGQKVILLKITNSGLFIVSGPFLINGVSLRRVNPRYTLPTGAKVNLENLDLSNFDDTYFKALSRSKKNRKENVVFSHRLRQFFVDRFLSFKIKKNFFLNAYLKTNINFSPFFY
mmetsp:Transcript_10833/g.25963  ORF Transcript_10833/g.25963 Transcript_10833/m.25963 type:complete len:215 (+) Transcript_10833:57-701(+)